MIKKIFYFGSNSIIFLFIGGFCGILITFSMLHLVQKPECWKNNPNPVVFNQEWKNLQYIKDVIEKRMYTIQNED